MLLCVLYINRNSIRSRLLPYRGSARVRTEIPGTAKEESKDIKAFNKTPLPLFVEMCSGNGRSKELRVLLIGNSILYHPVSDAVGWNHISGMAASSAEQDYGHLIFKELQQLSSRKTCIRISNLAEKFERRVTSFDAREISGLVDFKPHVVVFQLGENVVIDEHTTAQDFKKSYEELINLFKKSNKDVITICTLPFFPSVPKNASIEGAALNTGSFLVDLSHLSLLQAENYARNDTTITEQNNSFWKDQGVGMHPGNIGMSNIAKHISITIKAGLNAKAIESYR